MHFVNKHICPWDPSACDRSVGLERGEMRIGRGVSLGPGCVSGRAYDWEALGGSGAGKTSMLPKATKGGTLGMVVSSSSPKGCKRR